MPAPRIRVVMFTPGRFSRDVIWNLGSVLILGVCGFSLNIIIGRYYGAATFGIFSQVLAVYYVLSQLAVGGFVFSALNLVATHQDNRGSVREIITSALILTAGLAFIVCVTAYVLSGWIGRMFDSDAVRRGMLWVIPGVWFFALNKTLLFSASGLRHLRLYAVGNSLRFVLVLVCLVVLTLLRVDGSMLTMCFSAAEIILFPVLAGYLVRRYPPTLKNFRAWAGKHFHFGARTFFSGLLMDINLKVDVVLLGIYFSDKVVGVYNFAAMLAIEGLYQFVVAIQMNMNPLLTRLKLENRTDDLRKYMRKAIVTLCPALAVISCLIGFLYPAITVALTGSGDFAPGRIYFVVLMIGIVIGSSHLPFIFVLNQWGHPGLFTMFLLAIVVTNVILNLLLIPVFGALGSALGTGLSYVMTIVYLELFMMLRSTP